MKAKIVGTLITVIILSGCQLIVPSFEVKVELDEKAKKELLAKKETIVVGAEISGRPRKDSWVKENDKALGLSLGYFKKEIDGEGIVKFENIKISKYYYQALENKDYSVTISARSGWKSSEFNLLNCDQLSTGISRVAGKQHTIKCKLIKDPDEKFVAVPLFEIKVELDEKAKKELLAKEETIIADVLVSGTIRTESGIHAEGVRLPIARFKSDAEGAIKIEDMKIPEDFYNALVKKDYNVSVGLSPSKTDNLNLLSCEPFYSSISLLAGKQHTIKCKGK